MPLGSNPPLYLIITNNVCIVNERPSEIEVAWSFQDQSYAIKILHFSSLFNRFWTLNPFLYKNRMEVFLAQLML